MTPRPSVLPIEFGGVPVDLQSINRWVLWRYVFEKGDWKKVPFKTDGQRASSTNAQSWSTFMDVWDAYLVADYDGIGIIIIEDDFDGIDLDDCRDPLTGELSELAQRALDEIEGYAEVSPSATGIKLFSRTNLVSSITNHDKGIELYKDGRYFTVTGHRLNGHDALPVIEQDIGWLIAETEQDQHAKFEGTSSEVALANYKPVLIDWDLQRVVDEVLTHLDPNCGYHDWLRIGSALHHQGEGSPDWLTAWDAWSEPGKKYAQGICADKWKTFNKVGSSGKGVATLGILLKLTKDERERAQILAQKKAVDQAKVHISGCSDDQVLRTSIADAIRNDKNLDKNTREILVGLWNAKHKEITGARLQTKNVRELLGVNAKVVQHKTNAPNWAKPWVYVTDVNKFFNLESKQEVSSAGFKRMFNRFMPVNFMGIREQADIVATEDWGMPTVAHRAYMPNVGSIFSLFGKQWANLYRVESVPDLPGNFSDENLYAIELVKKHFELYISDQRERELFISWIAHNVQHPGSKIRWTPYVQGVPGDGKSFFGELMAHAMGGQNVRSLNGSTLESNFTDWAVGYAVTVIEEMKQHGHNRHDTMNKLKPFITNTEVEIHPKGFKSYVSPNNTNYLVLSNYLDGAPIEDEDRRYMFISSSLGHKAVLKLTEEGYYAQLFNAVEVNAGAIRQWFLTYIAHPEFVANGRAPHTDTKTTVVEMSKSELEIFTEDLFEHGAVGVGPTVVSSAHLSRALKLKTDEPFQTNRVNRMLGQKGFRFLTRRWWNGQACRVWVLQGEQITADAAIALLDKTLGADFLDSKHGDL